MNYDTANLRQFINDHFGPEDLRTFLFDYFRSVYDDLTDGMTKSRQIALLLEYCHSHNKFPDLVAAIGRERSFFKPDDYMLGSKAPATVSQPSAASIHTRNPRQIFISHAHQNAKVAQKLAHDLKAHGYDIWIAPDSIRPGEKWVEAINRGLEESSLFVLLLSPEAVASHWVQMETNAAITYTHEDEMHLYPLMLKKCRPPALWRAFHHISLEHDYLEGFSQLIADLNTRLKKVRVRKEKPTINKVINEKHDEHSSPKIRHPQTQSKSKTTVKSLPPHLVDLLVKWEKQAGNPNDNWSNILLKDSGDYSSFLKDIHDAQGGIKNIETLRAYYQKNPEQFMQVLNQFLNSFDNLEQKNFYKGIFHKYLFSKNIAEEVDNSNIRIHSFSGLKMIRVPADEFLYGNDKKKVYLDEFWMAKSPVTNAEYARFVAERKVKPPKHWNGSSPPAELADHPVVYVSWHYAKAYAEWAGLELPTEEQWEKAARSTDGRKYPWGDDWHENCCNTREADIGTTSPVGKFSPQGDSVYGFVDMAGNVWEWTVSQWPPGSIGRALRGGSWDFVQRLACVAGRRNFDPDGASGDIGFRLVVPTSAGF